MCYPNDTTIRYHLSRLVLPISRQYTDEHRSLKLEDLATLTHGGALALHGIGIGYHIYEKDFKLAGCHILAASFSIMSAYEHYKHKKYLVKDQESHE